MSEPRVLVANAGTLRVFRVARELHRNGLLRRCATSLYFSPSSLQWAPAALRKRLAARTANRRCAELAGMVATHPLPEVAHLIGARAMPAAASGLIAWRNRKFGEWVARNQLHGIDLVWGFDTSSLGIFEAARARGIRCILDVSIAHPSLGNRIMAEHAQHRPEYSGDLQNVVPERQVVQRVREMSLADAVVVGSTFVRDSLISEGVPDAKVKVNPYGVDHAMFSAAPDDDSPDGPRDAVFLFVGWFSHRKGVYYLLEAWERSGLGNRGAKLRLVGGDLKDLKLWKRPLPPNVEVMGRLAFERLPAVMRGADVFVFPSLFEGFAKVILEAMASGLPVITTPASCDASAVIDGENGFLVDSGDVDRLADCMARLAAEQPLRIDMSRKAVERSARFTWESYGRRCADLCRDVADGRGWS